MRNAKKEITVGINVQAELSKATESLASLKKQIDNFEIPKGIGTELIKEFNGIKNEIKEIQRMTASKEINLIDAKNSDKSIDKIEKRFNLLISKISEEGFLEKGLKKDAQAIGAMEAIQSAYNKQIKESEQHQLKLEKRLEEAKRKKQEILAVQKDQQVVSKVELEDQKAQLAFAEKQERAAKKARDEAEKALRVKIAESKGKYSAEDVEKKGSDLRKTQAFKDFRQSQTSYDAAKKVVASKKQKIDTITTKEMQAAQAQEATQAINEAENALEDFKKTSLEIQKIDAFKKSIESIREIEEFTNIDWGELGIDFSNINSIDDLKKELADLKKEAGDRTKKAFEELSSTLEESSGDFKKVGQHIKNAEEDLEDLNEQSKEMERFEENIKRFLGMAGAVELFRNALRSAFDTVKELDSAMTEMAVVTELDIGDYWEQLPEHTSRAKELGLAIEDVYKAETLYYQQGLKTEQVVGMSTETLKMARIAGLSAKDATDKMTAALRGFNMELNETSAQRVADVYSELAAITAADVNEISSAMSKTASIASSAGMEFETTAAFLSQIIETTRESAETAGTALKTVIARFQELKKSPNEIGEVDGEIVDANKIETALRSVGVSLRDSSGQFRELDDVFMELSSKWDTLDVNTQRYIATIAAGSRQQSRFLAMMSDYSRTQELVSAANDSAGASQSQYEKTLDSVETALARLKASWEEFSMGILNNDLVKFGINALTKLLEIINKATSAFDGMSGTITKVLMTITLFKIGQKVFDKIKQPLMNFLSSIVEELYEKGVQGGESYAKGMKDGAKKTAETKDSSSPKKELTYEEKKEKYLNKESGIKKALGFDSFKKIGEARKNSEEDREKLKELKNTKGNGFDRSVAYKSAQKDLKRAEKAQKKGKGTEADVQAAKSKVDQAEKDLVEYREVEEKVQQASAEGWKNASASLQQMGNTIAGVGVGVSALGGIFDSLGLEEVGELFTKVGNAIMIVGGAVSTFGTLLSAIPPLLTFITTHPIIAIITAVCAIVMGLITAVVVTLNKNSLSARMEEAQKSLEAAKKAAAAAEAEYEELLSAKSGYDDLQKQLDGLIRGTNEWREALVEVNNQVLELLQEYPELAKYVGRGDQGQLEISEAGWNEVLSEQSQAVKNTQGLIMSKQLNINSLREEAITSSAYLDNTKIQQEIKSLLGSTAIEYDKSTKALRKELEQIYIVADSSLEEADKTAEEIIQRYRDVFGELAPTAEQIELAADGLARSADEMRAIREESEATARAYLSTLASKEVTDSDFGEQAIDAFANSMNSEATQAALDNFIEENAADSGEDFKEKVDIMALAKEYGVEDKMTGKDKKSIQILYAEMAGLSGVDEIDSSVKDSESTMLKDIATMKINNDLLKGMEEYTNKLEEIAKYNEQDAYNVAGLLSDEGEKMTQQYASQFMTEEVFNREAVATEYENIFGKSMSEMASDLGKTEEELYDEIEQNVRQTIEINKNTFSKLNRVLKKADGTITDFGKGIELTTKTEANLSEKIVEAVQVAGVEGGEKIQDFLQIALQNAGEDAEKFGDILGTMSWSSADDWKELPQILDNLNIKYGANSLQKLKEEAELLGIIVDTVNFDTLTGQIQNLYDLTKKLQFGEQTRTFDNQSYEMLVQSNKELKNSFVQIGDKFYYLGNSMDELSTSLKQNTKELTMQAYNQLQSQQSVSDAIVSFEKSGGADYGGKELKLSDGKYTQWGDSEQIAFLEAFRASALEQGVNTLKYITDEEGNSLNLSLGTNFNDLSSEKRIIALERINELYNNNQQLKTETSKALSDATIASYLFNEADYNKNQVEILRSSGKEKESDEYGQALAIQATQSGMVPEEVISKYLGLINKDSKKLDSVEKDELADLEKTIVNKINESLVKLEDLSQINQMINEVSEALYNIQQKEIEKLSNINDSIVSANEALVNKIQQQIDYERQKEENQRIEEELFQDYSRIGYLMADTSGAGMLEANMLQQELTEKTEGYQDTLIDQSLQKLADDNAAAAEQRERQIAIMEAQLAYEQESGALQREAEAIVNNSLQQINSGTDPLNTKMYDILQKAANIEDTLVTDAKIQEFQKEFTEKGKGAADAFATISTIQSNLRSITNKIAPETTSEKTGSTAEQTAGTSETDRSAKRNSAIKDAVSIVTKTGSGGFVGVNTQGTSAYEEYDKAKQNYKEQGGDPEFFDTAVNNALNSEQQQKIKTGIVGIGENNKFKGSGGVGDEYGAVLGSINGTDYTYRAAAPSSIAQTLTQLFGQTAFQIVMFEGTPYIYHKEGTAGATRGNWSVNKGGWKVFTDTGREAIKKMPVRYESGGLADFTGPAWLDGTKSKPEIVLNQKDSANFIMLKDILSEVLNGTTDISKDKEGKTGNNYFDIEIKVEEMKDDYDVEQLANKIRSMIYDDATYRNVNAVSYIR